MKQKKATRKKPLSPWNSLLLGMGASAVVYVAVVLATSWKWEPKAPTPVQELREYMESPRPAPTYKPTRQPTAYPGYNSNTSIYLNHHKGDSGGCITFEGSKASGQELRLCPGPSETWTIPDKQDFYDARRLCAAWGDFTYAQKDAVCVSMGLNINCELCPEERKGKR